MKNHKKSESIGYTLWLLFPFIFFSVVLVFVSRADKEGKQSHCLALSHLQLKFPCESQGDSDVALKVIKIFIPHIQLINFNLSFPIQIWFDKKSLNLNYA